MKCSSSRLGSVVLAVAILATIAVVFTMFGAKLGVWEPAFGFSLIRNYMNPVGYVVAGLGLAGLVFQIVKGNRCGAVKAGIAGLIGLCILAPMLYGVVKPVKRAPPIHDITTDMSNPPVFKVLDDTRAGARNSLEYGGADVAKHQKKGYPDIAPIQTAKSAKDAFAQALNVADSMGWEMVDVNEAELRFEASARTPVYAFVDDVVVVVTALDNGSRVDIRSVSRIGRSDRGVNAARIRAFTQAFGQ